MIHRLPIPVRARAAVRATNGAKTAASNAAAQRHGLAGSISAGLGSLFSLTRLALWVFVILMAVALTTAWRERGERKIRFQSFEIAPPYAAAGYTPVNVPRRILDHIYAIRDSSGSLSSTRAFQLQNDKSLPKLDVDIAGQRLSLMDMASFLLSFRPDSAIDVGGEVLNFGSSGLLTLRAGSRSTRLPFVLSDSTIPDTIFHEAAKFVLLQTEPYILATYYANTEAARARELFAELTRSRQPRLRALALVGQAYLAGRTRDTRVNAERNYRLSMMADPSYVGACVNLAAMYNGRRRNFEALAVLERCPRGEAGWEARAATNRASILNDLDRYNEALSPALEAVATEDGLVHRVNIATALFGLGWYDQALYHLELTRLFDTTSSIVADMRSVILFLQGKAKQPLQPDQAGGDAKYPLRRDLIRALGIGPDAAVRATRIYVQDEASAQAAASLLSRIGGWLSIAGRHAEAAALSNTALDLDRDTPVLHWYAGMAACRRGVSDSAQVHFARFLDLDQAKNGALPLQRGKLKCG
jgi:tetratricopeptide (TPR) repeat protein